MLSDSTTRSNITPDKQLFLGREHFRISFSKGCAYIREDNPRAFASRLHSVQTHIPYNSFLIAPACIFTL